MDANGWLWVLDGIRVRRISPSGDVSTVADLTGMVPGVARLSNQATFLKNLIVHGTNRFAVIWTAWHADIPSFLGSRVFEFDVGATVVGHEVAAGLNAIAIAYGPSGSLLGLVHPSLPTDNATWHQLAPVFQPLRSVPNTGASGSFDFYHAFWSSGSLFPSASDGSIHLILPAAGSEIGRAHV